MTVLLITYFISFSIKSVFEVEFIMSDTSGITAEQLAYIVSSINSLPALELGLADAFPDAKFKISGTLTSMSPLNCNSHSLIFIIFVFLFLFLFHHEIKFFSAVSFIHFLFILYISASDF